MTDRVPIFVELCAGTAALSLRLEHPRARPPVSRMGAKTGYADVILRCMGLRPGQGAERYLWCEPDAGVRLLLNAYRDRELATAAADIIRGWADEDPRALWERLRAEGPAVCPPVDAREVARWAFLWRGSFSQKGPNAGIGTPEGRPQTATFGGFRPTIVELGEHIPALPTLPATIADDARKVDPREVARCLQIMASNELINLDSKTWKNTGQGGSTFGGAIGYGADRMLRKLEAAPTLPATIADDARAIDPPQLPPGVVVYIDPPYLDTTGYAHAFPRSEWIPVVRRWQQAGALVVVSEAEPIPELVADGWHAVRIDGERKGQKRTFSRQQAEWLTMSEPPRWRPSVQMGLWR